MTTRVFCRLALFLPLVLARPVFAKESDAPPAAAELDKENPGQEDLDEAVSLKLEIEDLGDLTRVIKLCDRAIEKGLNAENRDFANRLLASALLQRGQILAGAIFAPGQLNPRWQQMRAAALEDLHRAIKLDEQAMMNMLVARLESLPGGDRKKAAAAIDRAIEHGDDDEIKFEALMVRAGSSEDAEQKMADYEQAHQLRPDDAVPLRARGALKLSLNKPEDALADFDRAVEIDPKHAPTHEVRGMTLTLLKRPEEAKKAYDTAIELAPKSAAVFLQRAQLDFLTENFEAAIEEASQALEVEPELPAALLLRAQARLRVDQAELALKDAERAMELEPNFIPARKTLAMTLLGVKQIDKAAAELERILRDEPRDLETQLQLAILYRTQKDFTKAFKLFDTAVAIDPDNWMIRYARGDALLGIGRHKDAIADYNVAVKQSPKTSGLLNNLAWVLSTSPVEELRDGKRAIELAKMAAEATDYRQANVLSTLGAAYAEAGDIESAKQWVRKAMEVADDDDERKALEKELASYESGKPVRELQQEDQTALGVSDDDPTSSSAGAIKPSDVRR
jgi:tetratricopeptide (TPR) repeat protein